ncbi:adenine phosphoribosyltransferase [Psychroflexus aestuariivivens]|uniref:adenine phosphoribosyltransferase n=1 Tax=Psychroflexus aestuariivivens TaxID=1795040 RepID=UPI000FD8DADB|nr:adenine phosphoribosyltransferase [Psychroflexus aestuariivivens]
MLDLKKYIRNIPDFPKKGINYKDITPLLMNSKASEYTLDTLAEPLKNKSIDKVIGIESRGFLFGMLLAQKLDVGFVMIRKPGKLPAKTASQTYELEYGSDTIEIHQDAIKPGENVIIHDDLLATGGTAKAAYQLVEHLGGKIVEINFIIALNFLEGKKQLNKYPVRSLLEY